MGRRVRLTVDLQDDFALNHPLSLFVLEAVPASTTARPSGTSTSSQLSSPPWKTPGRSSRRNSNGSAPRRSARLKEEGMEYEDRIEVLRELEHPKPLAEFLYEVFDSYRVRHPWAHDHNVHPKSIVRDMYERSMSFAEYVAHYGIARSEGLLLRYLSDAYKALAQNVPEDMKSQDFTGRLRMARGNGPPGGLQPARRMGTAEPPGRVQEAALARGGRPDPRPGPGGGPPPLTANVRRFRVMVRNACFRRAELAAKRDWATLGELDQEAGWDAGRWEAAFGAVLAEHASIGTGLAARGARSVAGDEQGRKWRVRQVLDDPAGYHEWAIVARHRPRRFGPGEASRRSPVGGRRAGSGPGVARRPAPLTLVHSMAMRPLGRDEALQHLFVLGDRRLPHRGAHLPGQAAAASVLAHRVGRLLHAGRPHRGRGITEAYNYLGWS